VVEKKYDDFISKNIAEISQHQRVCLKLLKQKATAIRWHNIMLRCTENSFITSLRSLEVTIKSKPLRAIDVAAAGVGVLSIGIAIGSIAFGADNSNGECECPQLPM
jgi:hypothetical protein